MIQVKQLSPTLLQSITSLAEPQLTSNNVNFRATTLSLSLS